MLVYSGTKNTFQRDAINGVIANKIDSLFLEFGIGHESQAEFTSWKNSLPQMALIISDPRIDGDVQIAIEYQIPLTSKRVDFMIGGSDGVSDNVVITELKQWETCQATTRENVVIAFTGGANRDVAHPSQQAYSYAKLIENFNETVREENIKLIPCAFLHNYKEINRKEICNPKYQEAINDAPVFLQEDGKKLQEFLVKHVSKSSNKKLFEIIEYGKLRPSKSLQDSIGSIMNGNSDFEMIDEQQVAYATILKLVENSIGNKGKHTIIVQGGPGTGKSVIAINLLAKILNNNYSCVYVTKNSAPRSAFSSSLIIKSINSEDLKLIGKKEFDVVVQVSGGFLNRIYSTIVAFEIDGGEHIGSKRTAALDRQKEEICKKYGVRLIRIPNSSVKDYESIISLFEYVVKDLKDIDEAYTQMSLFDIE